MTLTIARPAGTVENDVMIAAIGVRPNTAVITPPGEWTLIRRTDNAVANANSLAVYYKVASANEPTNYTWTFSASTGSVGGIQTFFNVDTVNPINVDNGQTTASGLSHAAPAITTTVANAMLVGHYTFSSSATWIPQDPDGGGPLLAMTESYDVASLAAPNAAGQSLEGTRIVQAAAGLSAAYTSNASANADFGNTHMLALRPLPANTIAIATPAGTASGDVMIASIGFQPNTLTLTPPAGWISVRRMDNATGTPNSLEVFLRTAGASEPAAYAWTFSAGLTAAAGGIQSFAGVDTANPVNVENGQTTASALPHATPSVTTTVANTMLVTSHTFASSATWTPPPGPPAAMIESYDRANLVVPNAAGQSIEGNRLDQGAVGATGVKTATASANADTGNTHILALRPNPVAAAAGAFNAYETTTAASAINGVIATKVAGANVSLDIVALNATRTAILTTFTGTVRVEVLNSSDNSGPLDPATGCRSSWTSIQTLSPDPVFTAADNGRMTISFTQANSYPNARLRISFPVVTPTQIGCSSDNFAIRPNTFASFAVTDTDWETTGTPGSAPLTSSRSRRPRLRTKQGGRSACARPRSTRRRRRRPITWGLQRRRCPRAAARPAPRPLAR